MLIIEKKCDSSVSGAAEIFTQPVPAHQTSGQIHWHSSSAARHRQLLAEWITFSFVWVLAVCYYYGLLLVELEISAYMNLLKMLTTQNVSFKIILLSRLYNKLSRAILDINTLKHLELQIKKIHDFSF